MMVFLHVCHQGGPETSQKCRIASLQEGMSVGPSVYLRIKLKKKGRKDASISCPNLFFSSDRISTEFIFRKLVNVHFGLNFSAPQEFGDLLIVDFVFLQHLPVATSHVDVSREEIVDIVDEDDEEADGDEITFLAQREGIIAVFGIGPAGRQAFRWSGADVEEVLIEGLIVAKLEPEDDAVPDRDDPVEQDREEDVVVEAGKVGDARQVLSDVKLVRHRGQHQQVGEAQAAFVAGFRRIRAIIRRI